MSSMEAEMARFEEEISHEPGFNDQNESFNAPPPMMPPPNAPPPMMPPPMFLPHALQQNSKQQKFDDDNENDNECDVNSDFGFLKHFSSNRSQMDAGLPPGIDRPSDQPNNNRQHTDTDQMRSFNEPEPGLMPPTRLGPDHMGPGPMGPGPMGSGPMGPGSRGPGSIGPGPRGPGPMGLGPMGPRGFGPMGPRPMGPGPMGLGPGPMGPGPLRHGPMSHMGPMSMGPGPMPPNPTGNISGLGIPRPDGPNFIGPNNDSMIGPMPPPMPGFFPPPVLPDFGNMRKQQSVYSSAPVLKKRVVSKKSPISENKEKQSSEPTENKLDSPKIKMKEENQKKLEKKEESLSSGDLPGTSNKHEVGLLTGPQALNQTGSQLPMASHTPFTNQPMLYGLSPLAGNPQLAKAAAQTQKRKKMIRTAAGQKWEDPTLQEWDSNDYRLFCGDLGNEVTDDTLARVFSRYSSFQKARVVREKNSKKSKGYGFVSFKDPTDFIRAMREINGKYVGNRPIKLRKSSWKDRNVDIVRKKIKEKKKLGYKV